jgi:hypothetical protein
MQKVVGSSPIRRRLGSKATIRSRVVGQHLRGNIGASTFRLSLTALLWEQQAWHPCWKGDRALLPSAENKRLTKGQDDQLRITWLPGQQPWEIEGDVIAALAPPLNLAENKALPFHATLKAGRAALRAYAKQNPC